MNPQPWLAHVNIACADLARQTAFYAALAGTPAVTSPRLRNDARLDHLADIAEVALRMAWVPVNNLQIELIHYSAPASSATTEHSTRRAPQASGHAYIAFEVSDVTMACAHLLACGGHVLQTDAQGARATDPEGNALWLLARAGLGARSFSQLADPRITARFAASQAQLSSQGTT
jgi:catechol 2,3-dioxygenase-like lactoylglutathione lyase family enzyme